MPIYRVLHDMTRGHEERIRAGTVDTLDWLKPKHISVLVERGVISEILGPPLEVLPGWTLRAQKVEAHGIHDVEQFLLADAGALAEWLEVKVETIAAWKRELLEWLKPPQERGR